MSKLSRLFPVALWVTLLAATAQPPGPAKVAIGNIVTQPHGATVTVRVEPPSAPEVRVSPRAADERGKFPPGARIMSGTVRFLRASGNNAFYEAKLAGLKPGTEYFVVAYARGPNGRYTNAQQSFRTSVRID